MRKPPMCLQSAYEMGREAYETSAPLPPEFPNDLLVLARDENVPYGLLTEAFAKGWIEQATAPVPAVAEEV